MLGFVAGYSLFQVAQSRAYSPPRTPVAQLSPSLPVYGKNQILQFETTTIDFGEVSSHEMHERSVSFVNATDQVVRVAEVKSGCNCSYPELDKDLYQPGEKGTMIVLLNPMLAQKHFHVSLSVAYQGLPQVDTLICTGRLID